MRPAHPIDAYRPAITPIEDYLYGNAGKQPGDPAKAAEAMIQVVESADPPLRLLLGADAIGLWEQKQAAQRAEFGAWREVGEGTAYEGVEVIPVGG